MICSRAGSLSNAQRNSSHGSLLRTKRPEANDAGRIGVLVTFLIRGISVGCPIIIIIAHSDLLLFVEACKSRYSADFPAFPCL